MFEHPTAAVLGTLPLLKRIASLDCRVARPRGWDIGALGAVGCAAPGEVGEVQGEGLQDGGYLGEDLDAGADDFGADAVAGYGGDLVGFLFVGVGLWDLGGIGCPP